MTGPRSWVGRSQRGDRPPAGAVTKRTPTATALDRLIGWVAPGWGARRAADRVRMQVARAYYDGATTGRRGASIRRRIADANQVSFADLPKLRYGSHDLVRNNPHARRAVEVIVSNTVGAVGMTPQFMRKGKPAADIQELADRFFGSTDMDADGRLTYAGMQAAALQSAVEGGDACIRRRRRRLDDGLLVPLQFQLLEGDYIDSSRDGPVGPGGRMVQGVEFDPIGRRRAYWMFKEHPGGRYATGISSPVPARDVLHIYRVDRPGQVRGIPWLSPVMLRLADFADYEEAQLVREKIAACFAGFIEEPFDATSSTLPPNTTEDDDGNLIDTLEPGTVERLPAGTKMTFASPPPVQGYQEYSQVSLHAISVGMGISYEAETGDLRGVNFSSGKMGRLEMEQNVARWRVQIIVPQICDPATAWFLEAAMLAGYDVEGVTVQHIPPKRVMIDPTREYPAERDAIRAGQKTLSESIRERGKDPAKHLDEIQNDNKMLDERGIVLDSDPRNRSAVGNAVQSGGGAAGSGGMAQAMIDSMDGLARALEDYVPMIGGRR